MQMNTGYHELNCCIMLENKIRYRKICIHLRFYNNNNPLNNHLIVMYYLLK